MPIYSMYSLQQTRLLQYHLEQRQSQRKMEENLIHLSYNEIHPIKNPSGGQGHAAAVVI